MTGYAAAGRISCDESPKSPLTLQYLFTIIRDPADQLAPDGSIEPCRATGIFQSDPSRLSAPPSERFEVPPGAGRQRSAIDPPWSYFDLAEIRLYEGKTDEFLNLAGKRTECAQKWQVDTFHGSLKRLIDAGVDVPGMREVSRCSPSARSIWTDGYSIALTMSSTTFFASPNTIIVLSR